jgi:hypothetical protein
MVAQLYSYSEGKYTMIPASYVNTYYLRKPAISIPILFLLDLLDSI